LISASASEDQAQGRPQKFITLTQGILKITLVPEVNQLMVVDKEDKGGWGYASLGEIEKS
jgi:hypothetical protein